VQPQVRSPARKEYDKDREKFAKRLLGDSSDVPSEGMEPGS
jgi:hypothetical protein